MSSLSLRTSLFLLGLVAGCAGSTQATGGTQDSGVPLDGPLPVDSSSDSCAACVDAADAPAPPSCPPGTALVDGQCDDIRCPDELPSGMTSLVGLPDSRTTAWPRFRHDNRNSGWTRVKMAPSPAIVWQAPVGYSVGLAIDVNKHLFLGVEAMSGAGSLLSLDESHNVLYTFPFGSMGTWTPSIPAVRADGTAYAATTAPTVPAGEFWAISPTGTKVWSYSVVSNSDGHPIVAHDGTLVYGSDDHSLYAMDANGNFLWKTDPTTGPGEVDGGLAESCDGHIYAGGSNGWAALDIMTGQNLWFVPVPSLTPNGPRGAVTSSPVVAADGTMYGIDDQGVGWAIDATGKVLWTRPLASGPYGMRISSGKLGNELLVLSDGNLLAVDTATGNELWSKPGGFTGGPIIDGNMNIYVNGENGTVSAFDRNGTPLWQIPTGSSSSAELAIGGQGTLYVESAMSLYAIQ